MERRILLETGKYSYHLADLRVSLSACCRDQS